MISVDDFAHPFTEAAPRRRRVGATTDSIALVANAGGIGCVLACDGEAIEIDFDIESSKSLCDHGLDDAPDGISIWEGKGYASSGTYEHPLETDFELVGKFRQLTDREWELLRTTGTPWEFAP